MKDWIAMMVQTLLSTP